MKPSSFVHVADLHLGYAQYNLDARRQDFNRAFEEAEWQKDGGGTKVRRAVVVP